MAHELDLDDSDLFNQCTALSADGSGVKAQHAVPVAGEPSATHSDLPEVGIDADEKRPQPAAARAPRVPSVGFAALGYDERYTERRLLGRGGMGEVLLCRDHTVGRDVAMKVIRKREAQVGVRSELRFVREARVQGQLEHPAIVPVYDLGTNPEGALYFTMKRLRGASLADILAGLRAGDAPLAQRYTQRRLLTLLSQVCMALHFAHQKGVLHRDVKPANIMFGDFGEVYVLDWGLAAVRNEASSPTDAEPIDDGRAPLPLATGVMGTPGYMAPEQIETPQDVDSRADVYGLGAILFEILTLTPMHTARSPAELLASTLQIDGASLASALDGDIAPELSRLCFDATRLRPEARIPSAQALSQRIEAYLDGDRDLSRRRELASMHAARARDALVASRAAAHDEASLRALAMREVSAALGLDPTHDGAQETLVLLITEAPRVLPREAEAEIEQNRRETYRLTSRAALLFYLGYLVYLPLLLWMGVRDGQLFALGWGTIGACAVATYVLGRRPPKRIDVPLAHLVVSTFTVGCVSVMFGPFVLVPMLALGNAVAYVASVGHRRGLVFVTACLAVVVPCALRWCGVIPDNYVFADGKWTILPSVFHIDPLATQVFLLVAILGTIVPATLFVARLRKAYADAERKLQLQAWHLRQIAPLPH